MIWQIIFKVWVTTSDINFLLTVRSYYTHYNWLASVFTKCLWPIALFESSRYFHSRFPKNVGIIQQDSEEIVLLVQNKAFIHQSCCFFGLCSINNLPTRSFFKINPIHLAWFASKSSQEGLFLTPDYKEFYNILSNQIMVQTIGIDLKFDPLAIRVTSLRSEDNSITSPHYCPVSSLFILLSSCAWIGLPHTGHDSVFWIFHFHILNFIF